MKKAFLHNIFLVKYKKKIVHIYRRAIQINLKIEDELVFIYVGKYLETKSMKLLPINT